MVLAHLALPRMAEEISAGPLAAQATGQGNETGAEIPAGFGAPAAYTE